MCNCSSEPEATAHFLLRRQNHVISRSKLDILIFSNYLSSKVLSYSATREANRKLSLLYYSHKKRKESLETRAVLLII